MTSRTLRRGSLILATFALILATFALVLAACGGGGDATAGPDTTAPSDATAPATGAGGTPAPDGVVIRLIAFRPEALAVPAGTTVTWKNQDASSHTVTSGTVTQGAGTVTIAPDGRFDSGALAQDGTFEFTFDEAGTFPYFCSVHPATMRGEVQVT